MHKIAYKGEKAVYNEKTIHGPRSVIEKDSFTEFVLSETERIKPLLGEQLLRQLITGAGDTNEILDIYCRALNVDIQQDIRLAVLSPLKTGDIEKLFFTQNTARQYIENENILLCTVAGDFVVIITTLTEQKKLAALLDKIRDAVYQRYDYSMLAVYSRTERLAEAGTVFERMRICRRYSFYAEGSRTLYENDIVVNDNKSEFCPEYAAIEQAVKNGDTEKVTALIGFFWSEMKRTRPAPHDAKIHCLNLYAGIIGSGNADKLDCRVKDITLIQEAQFLSDIQQIIDKTSTEITQRNAPERKKIYSALVRDTIDIIDQNIKNENLSLRWLAGTILYTNVDYLGKLFRKETGKNFSHYVMEKRMEMAKNLILEGKKDRIYEIAENVGYGSNSQYFSQVFKKYTGVSPLEYKEFARLSRENQS